MPEKSYDDSRPAIPSEIARSVKVEAGHRCAIKACPEHTYLEIHHINENREDNQLENLILLCDKHHKMAHAGVIDKKSLHEYKKILNLNNLNTLLERFEKLESMLAASAVISPSTEASLRTINLVLEEAHLLGNKLRGTPKGNELAQQIYSLIRKHGSQMGIDSVEMMVRRPGSYSRTGIDGLAILYDEHFEHAKSLNLIEHFKRIDMQEVAYYCALREHFPSEEDMSACLRSIEFKWNGLRVVSDKYHLFSKYPNRGPSVILDYLVYEDGNPDA